MTRGSWVTGMRLRGMAAGLAMAGGLVAGAIAAPTSLPGTAGSAALLSASLPTVQRVEVPRVYAEFEALVQCRTILADLDWAQRIWPEANPDPKPPRSTVLPDTEIRRQVEDLLRQESALRALYGVELDSKALQTELNRIAIGTRAPERLREQYQALGQDAEAVANCVARPLLIERRLREGYALDARWHGALRQRAEAALAAGAGAAALAASGGREQTLTLVREDEKQARDPAAHKANELRLTAEEYARERARLLPEQPKSAPLPTRPRAGLRETEDAFVEETVLSQDANRLVLRSRVWAKQPFEAWWAARRADHAPGGIWKRASALRLPEIQGKALAAPAAAAGDWKLDGLPSERYYHSAVWTGTEMIIWGGSRGLGGLNTGGRYNPATDSWTAMAVSGAPEARVGNTTVWTGSEMIIWGGYTSSTVNTGGRYNPTTNSWTATTLSGAPSARNGHTAVWTGSEMIVWGGQLVGNTGGRYNPATDSWTATTTTGAPSEVYAHTAVWTGSEMIVWGGLDNGFSAVSNGGRYNPTTDSWTATQPSGEPIARYYHTAVWTGSEMIIWGGSDTSSSDTNTGGRYNPATNAWTATTISGAPSARNAHTVVWTGSEMIVWGGYDMSTSVANTGYRYNPATNNWTATTLSGAPAGRGAHTAVWTGSEMIVWGGGGLYGLYNTGGRYNPATDSWTATRITVTPSARYRHTAVWTGSEMIVWGGSLNVGPVDTGGRYKPATDSWTATPISGAPSGAYFHTAVWTGSEMIVWGGISNSVGDTNAGGRYNPATNTWTATQLSGAPGVRGRHTAVWTGSEMIVWGGYAGLGSINTGGRYNPATDSWTATQLSGAPSARNLHAAVWTGNEMIVWGGSGSSWLGTGGRYNPATDTWTTTQASGAPSARYYHAALWTGSEMIVWGGYDGTSLNTGARYNPVTDAWTATPLSGAPSPRYQHSVVWTGSEMIVWGGNVSSFNPTNTGGRYDPVTNAWTPTQTLGAASQRAEHTAVWSGREMIVFGGCCEIADPGIYYPYASEASTTTITADLPDPSVLGQAVTIEVAVSGERSRPIDGQVVVTASTGETCTDTTASAGSGITALFACSIPFNTLGARNLTAVYSASSTHDGSTSATAPHTVITAPSLSISDLSQVEGTGGSTNFQFTVTRSHTLNDVSVQVDTGVGTATVGSDYTAIVAQALNFTAGGANTATVSVTVAADAVVEGNETFVVNLSNAVGATISDNQGLGTIVNDDTATVAINSLTQDEGNSGSTSFVFTATLSGAVQGGFTVPVASANGTATAGTDYTAIAGGATLNFSGALNETRTVTVAVTGETLYEFDESFSVTLGTPSLAAVTVTTASGTGTIRNDDAAPTISISSPSQNEGNVGNTPMNFVVSLSTAAGRPVSFTRATANGTATLANNDYVQIAAGTATIPAGDTMLSIPVQIVGDSVYEGNETFSLALSAVDGATPTTLSGTGTILDDDQQPTTTVISSHTPSTTVVGQPYTVTVTVTGQTLSPTGTVTITDGAASCGPVTLSAGTAPTSTASCSLSSTTAGNKTLTASYVPSSTAYAASSGTTSHAVGAAATTISVTGPARSRVNQPTAFTYALTVTAPGAGTPTGTVTLSSGSSSCTATLPATSCSLSVASLGSRTVSASYAGDGNFASSTSSGAGNAPTLVYALSDLSVTKTDGEAMYEPGDLIVYTVQLRNAGPDAAAQVRVQDLVPAGLTAVTWSCDASGGAVCDPAGASGNLDQTLAMLPVGALWNYTFYGTVSGAPEQIVNTATLTLPADTTVEDPSPGNNTASDINLLSKLFANGFETPLVSGPEGSIRLRTAALAPVLDTVARRVFELDDTRGTVARVYARLHLGAVEYALATRGTDGRWTLGPWTGYAVEPTLSWQATAVADAWQLTRVDMR